MITFSLHVSLHYQNHHLTYMCDPLNLVTVDQAYHTSLSSIPPILLPFSHFFSFHSPPFSLNLKKDHHPFFFRLCFSSSTIDPCTTINTPFSHHKHHPFLLLLSFAVDCRYDRRRELPQTILLLYFIFLLLLLSLPLFH